MTMSWRGLLSKIRDSKRSGTITRWSAQESVADGGKFDLPASTNGGVGFAQIGDRQEYSFFVFSSAGAVTTIGASANVSTTEDNDTTFNIFDSGSVVGINNELGSTLNVLVIIYYN